MRTPQDRLARLLAPPQRTEQVRTSQAMVTAVDDAANTISVELNGVSVTGIPAQAGMLPEVGQQVLLVTTGTSPIALPPPGPLLSAPPQQVSGVIVAQAPMSLAIKWDPVTDLDVTANRGYYQLQVDSDDSFIAPFVDKHMATTVVVITGDDLNLEPSDTYYARVRAVDRADVPGEWSDIASGQPGLIRYGWLDADVITARELAAGAITTELLSADAIDGLVITGSTIQTSSDGPRVVITPIDDEAALQFFTGLHAQTLTGLLGIDIAEYSGIAGAIAQSARMRWRTPALNFYEPAEWVLESTSDDGTTSFARAFLTLGDHTEFQFTRAGIDAPGFTVNGTEITPVGAAMVWTAPGDPPAGWIRAGEDASRILHPRLFELYGTVYGAGDGATTFATPGMSDYAGFPFIIKAI